jgi:hypothetical protein
MRILISVAMAGAIVAATPALAQNNAAGNGVAANAAATNEGAPLNATSSMPAAPTTPGGQPTTPPPTSTTGNHAGTAAGAGQEPSFPWGVLGLLGLVGLLGRKRSS